MLTIESARKKGKIDRKSRRRTGGIIKPNVKPFIKSSPNSKLSNKDSNDTKPSINNRRITPPVIPAKPSLSSSGVIATRFVTTTTTTTIVLTPNSVPIPSQTSPLTTSKAVPELPNAIVESVKPPQLTVSIPVSNTNAVELNNTVSIPVSNTNAVELNSPLNLKTLTSLSAVTSPPLSERILSLPTPSPPARQKASPTSYSNTISSGRTMQDLIDLRNKSKLFTPLDSTQTIALPRSDGKIMWSDVTIGYYLKENDEDNHKQKNESEGKRYEMIVFPRATIASILTRILESHKLEKKVSNVSQVTVTTVPKNRQAHDIFLPVAIAHSTFARDLLAPVELIVSVPISLRPPKCGCL